ncbi:P-loop NTPase [Bradyrhizobium cenepequi]
MEENQKRTSSDSPRFEAFGRALIDLRRAARIERQADFAALVKSTQQTVSRWEAGLSRPREKQIPLIARVLGVTVDQLLNAAGYTVRTTVTTFDQPFPVDALLPESFERLCVHILQRVHRDASVHQAGGRGHTQDGTDILVTLPDGTRYSFQCKRAEEFGPQKVHAAVAKHTVRAAKKFIVLSRVASPQAREAVASHKGWEIWDRDDISVKIRELPKIDQIALVDIFFPGRRFDLLGVTEEGVWETTEEFFAAFENPKALFNHTWTLVGRANSLAELTARLKDEKTRITLLIGSGGSGKSRVLKEVIEAFEASDRRFTVRFLSRTAEVTKKSLEDLGTQPSLLVVDDAHDRTDLPLLLQYAATRERVRLVLALRPYGVEHLKAQAGSFALADALHEIVLKPLTKLESEDLARQVLMNEKGPLETARDIADLTYDCPLATVVGAQIVSREKKHFELARNEDAFRSTLFGRFEAVIAGDLGQKSDSESIKKLLHVLALFQPFYLDDPQLLSIAQKLEGIQPHDANRLLKLLIDAGVLFKRGARYRLSPDVLADYVIKATCVGAAGRSTGYAEIAFDSAGDRLLENLLLNLGKLDWRLSNGDASDSKLLDGVWSRLRPRVEYLDPHIRAVQSVAFYQPLRAIEFGESLIRQGQFLRQLPEIFRLAAYNFDHLSRACVALWEIGKDDPRELHSHPDHAIRILGELCEVQPNKPLAYNEAVVEFALQLAKQSTAWSFHYSPLDVLSEIFNTEGHTTTSRNHSISFHPFAVAPKAVMTLRQRALDAAIELLGNAEVRTATRAAKCLEKALRYPMGLFDLKVDRDLREEWTSIFCETLESIEQAVRTNTYDPLVLVEIARAVSWHVNYSKSRTAKSAKKVKDAVSSSLDYRVLASLIDGYGTELRRFNPSNFVAAWDKHLKSLASEVVAKYSDGEKLRAYMADHLQHIQRAKLSGAAPHSLYAALLRASPSLVVATITDALHDAGSLTVRFSGDALLTLRHQDVSLGRQAAKAFLESHNAILHYYLGRALAAVDYTQSPYGEEEAKALEALVASNHEDVVSAAIYGIRAVCRHSSDEAMRLARLVNVAGSRRLADELLCLFEFGEELPFPCLGESDMELLLGKLMDVPELEGHWTQSFLANASKTFPDQTLDFLIARVEHAIEQRTWKYRPVNHGPYVHVPLKFKESGKYGALLSRAIGWMAKATFIDEQKVIFKHRSAELFDAAFGSFDNEVVQFLDQWSSAAGDAAFEIIANVLREAPHTFVFDRVELVLTLLTRAQRIGPSALDRINSALMAASIGGLRQGTPGEPFPRDLETKSECEKVLSTLSKFSPAYELYDELLKHAKSEIARSMREREEFED